MKAQELRIGNLVNRIDRFNELEIFKIYGISGRQNVYDEDDSIHGCDELIPILLTEDWLVKFGFEDWGKDRYGYTKYVLHNVIDGTSNFGVDFQDGEECCPVVDEELCAWGEFKHVHQLQNLYFALTGKELIIK